MRRMLAGDESAFETFADHYIPGLYRFAASRLRGQRELAAEIVQSTVCKVIEGLRSYRGEASLFAWMCGCCRNEIAGHYRRQQGRPTLVDIDSETAGVQQFLVDWSSPDPEELLLDTETDSLVHLALDSLPPKYASVLEWKYLEGVSVDDIARRLEVRSKAAESLLTRARKAFRVVYERLGERAGQAASR